MTRRDEYRSQLARLQEWEPYLRRHSGLPGPRANLELAQAAADEGSLERFNRFLEADDEYLAVCGAIGLGRLVAEGQRDLPRLRRQASDPRWRAREGVVLGLQRLGAADLEALLAECCNPRR